MDPAQLLPPLPGRPSDGHKGTFGRVLLAAGSRGMSGAAVLAGLGALRSGSGLVTLAVPASLVPVVASIEPACLVLPLSEDVTGTTGLGGLVPLRRAAMAATAVAIGPGWGRGLAIEVLAETLYVELDRPLVVDADGLNALAVGRRVLARGENRPRPSGPRVLTPHPGEMARVLGTDIASVEADRESVALELASRTGAVVVLKGAATVVTDGDRLVVNSTGNSGLATGGSGDVLTGLIAGLLARGMPVFDAAWLGVHLHGLAADLAVAELAESGLIASDLPDWIPAAWCGLEAELQERREN